MPGTRGAGHKDLGLGSCRPPGLVRVMVQGSRFQRMTPERVCHGACGPLLGLVSRSLLPREKPSCPPQWAENCVQRSSHPCHAQAGPPAWDTLRSSLPLKPQLLSHPPPPRALPESAWLGHHSAPSRSLGQGSCLPGVLEVCVLFMSLLLVPSTAPKTCSVPVHGPAWRRPPIRGGV